MSECQLESSKRRFEVEESVSAAVREPESLLLFPLEFVYVCVVARVPGDVSRVLSRVDEVAYTCNKHDYE